MIPPTMISGLPWGMVDPGHVMKFATARLAAWEGHGDLFLTPGGRRSEPHKYAFCRYHAISGVYH